MAVSYGTSCRMILKLQPPSAFVRHVQSIGVDWPAAVKFTINNGILVIFIIYVIHTFFESPWYSVYL